MVASTLITDYFAEGTHAARPVTPNVATGATAIYFETDTLTTFAWSGTAWVQISAATGPTIVQKAAISGLAPINSVTFGAAPTNGNMLIAFADNVGDYPHGAGWTILVQNNGGDDYATILYKIAGAGESVTQTYSNQVSVGAAVVYELANAGPSFGNITPMNFGGPYSITLPRAGGLLLGTLINEATNDLPTAVTGAVLDISSAVGARSAQGFHFATPTAGANSIAYTYAATHHAYGLALAVY